MIAVQAVGGREARRDATIHALDAVAIQSDPQSSIGRFSQRGDPARYR